MNWGEILSEIKRSLKEPEDNGHWSDDEYLRRANMIQRTVCRDAECIINVDTSTLSVVDQATYDKPSNSLRIKSVMYGNTKLYEIEKTELDLGVLNGNLTSPWQEIVGTPNTFYQERTEFVVFPVPDTADDVISIISIDQAADLVESSDIPFDDDFDLEDAHELLVTGVLWKCLLESKDKFYSEYKKEFENGVLKLRRNMKQKINVMDSFDLLGKRSSRDTSPLPIIGA